MDKMKAYHLLVMERKVCHACAGLVNPADVENGIYDFDEIGPWTLWQGNLNAKIMVVGQDWGDTNFFTKWKGGDPPSGTPTNSNLQRLLQEFGISIKNSGIPQDQFVFLTNLVLCLKEGGMQATVRDEWLSNCSTRFFRRLVELVSPRVVMALGKNVAETILDTYGTHHLKSWTLDELMTKGPFKLFASTYLFPVYHCGAGGVNRNRPLQKQIQDWRRASAWLRG